MPEGLYLGLMSGTSTDAIDASLVDFAGGGAQLVASHEHPIPTPLKRAIAAISHSGDGEIESLGVLDRQIGQLFADAALQLLQRENVGAAEVAAIGSHGQTIRHRPPSGGHDRSSAFSLQIGDPNTIAEQTGICTVADFRRRDIAAGGEGAPLAPAFHRAVFAREDKRRAIVNIGGFANVSLLDGRQLLAGFDTGPGNTLLDQWHQRHRGSACDRDGAWSAEGEVNNELLSRLLRHEYFSARGPRSTGKEEFNLPWLDQHLAGMEDISPQSVQASLAELTASTIAAAITASDLAVQEVFVCGGGAHNTDLMRRLHRLLSPAYLANTNELGIHPDWVEAAAFAWLARRRLQQLPGNVPEVTGARGERVLGAIYPA